VPGVAAPDRLLDRDRSLHRGVEREPHAPAPAARQLALHAIAPARLCRERLALERAAIAGARIGQRHRFRDRAVVR
jgi:hypothetical protein